MRGRVAGGGGSRKSKPGNPPSAIHSEQRRIEHDFFLLVPPPSVGSRGYFFFPSAAQVESHFVEMRNADSKRRGALRSRENGDICEEVYMYIYVDLRSAVYLALPLRWRTSAFQNEFLQSSSCAGMVLFGCVCPSYHSWGRGCLGMTRGGSFFRLIRLNLTLFSHYTMKSE